MSSHVTVVIPTCGRIESLTRALGGLAGQRELKVPWDVVVVDNTVSSGVEAAVRAVVPSFPVPLHVVCEPRRGTSRARNRGLAAASGDVVAFVDDDVVPHSNWLARLVAPLLEGRCRGVGGRIQLDPSVQRPRWFMEDWMGGYLAAFDLGDCERALSAEEYVLTANAAFATEPLRALGGFDENLGPRDGVYLTNEDVDLCRRLMVHAGPIWYIPSATVVHELPPGRLRLRYLIRRMYVQGRSDWALDRHVLGDSFLDALVELIWPRITYIGRLLRYEPVLSRAVPLRAFCELSRVAGMLVEVVRAARAGLRRQEMNAHQANPG